MWKFAFILFFYLPLACKADSNLTSKLAVETDLPPGVLSEPGESSGIWLGQYKTCREYAKYIFSRMGLPALGAFLNPDQPVKCKNSHTCQCVGGKYFIEDFRGKGKPVYRCVESPSAGVEDEQLYHRGEKPGLIKFALPKSVCENKPQETPGNEELKDATTAEEDP